MDPAVPASEWELDERGKARIEAFATAGLLANTAYIFSSSQKMASQSAAIIADRLSLFPVAFPEMDESDNMTSGYLPEKSFLDHFKRFFSKPEESAGDGWETAMDAQDRIAAAYQMAMECVISSGMRGDVLMVGHGRVGALLYCYLTGQAIGQDFTPPSPGFYFTYDWGARSMLHGWRSMEES